MLNITNYLKLSSKKQVQAISKSNIDSISTLALTGPRFRKNTKGPEYDLVKNYIRSKLPKAPIGQSRTIFIEPSIESSFPDIVIAYWRKDIANSWSNKRAELLKKDIKLLHYMSLVDTTDIEELNSFFKHDIEHSLERLLNANMILYTAGAWKARSIDDIFSITRLIAIEAKISEWKNGLQQAFRNTWYASESYLLIPNMPNNIKLISGASSLGVGIVTGDQPLENAGLKSREENIPSSYVSWLFNEWTWKAECLK
jgi:hypothetical protein